MINKIGATYLKKLDGADLLRWIMLSTPGVEPRTLSIASGLFILPSDKYCSISSLLALVELKISFVNVSHSFLFWPIAAVFAIFFSQIKDPVRGWGLDQFFLSVKSDCRYIESR